MIEAALSGLAGCSAGEYLGCQEMGQDWHWKSTGLQTTP